MERNRYISGRSRRKYFCAWWRSEWELVMKRDVSLHSFHCFFLFPASLSTLWSSLFCLLLSLFFPLTSACPGATLATALQQFYDAGFSIASPQSQEKTKPISISCPCIRLSYLIQSATIKKKKCAGGEVLWIIGLLLPMAGARQKGKLGNIGKIELYSVMLRQKGEPQCIM